MSYGAAVILGAAFLGGCFLIGSALVEFGCRLGEAMVDSCFEPGDEQ